MFYATSKIAWVFADPGNLLVALLAAGCALQWGRFWRLGRALLGFAATALLLITVLPIGNNLLWALESRFPPWVDDGPVDGIAVLGGAIDPNRYFWRPGSGINAAVGRITEAGLIAKKYTNARIIFAGGSGRPGDEEDTESAAARQLWTAMGVGDSRITLEYESRNTCENAYFIQQLAKPRPGERWLVMTSAFHMPRTMGCFRAIGFDVIPYPVDFRIAPGARRLRWAPSLAGGMERFSLAIHEFSGLATYRLMGRIADFFPAP